MNIRIFIVLALIFSVLTTKGADTFTINLNTSSTVSYCSTSVSVAPAITISASFHITGMKISISQGYLSTEDQLTYSASIGNIAGTWYPAQGYLLLQGDANSTSQDYQDAIRAVNYINSKPIPTLGSREITFTLMDADYLPETQHFYRFIDRPGITWTTARDEAASTAMMYFGLRGYLATVTSQAENDFIKLKTKGVGWIGASDHAVEGDWRWVTGPEGLEDGGQGRLFWRGTGADYAARISGTGPILGRYSNWNTGEPNDSPDPNIPHQEDYAHITFFPGNPANSYKWNDLPNTGGTGDYMPAGYLIEYGGMTGDPVVQLSATLNLQVNTMVFAPQSIPAICQGDTVTLNRNRSPVYAAYSWSPVASLSNDTLASPVATPHDTTTYRVYGTRGSCRDSAYFTVPVIPLPVVGFSIDSTTCVGYNLDVSYIGNAIPAISNFTWIFGGDTIANGAGLIKENIPLGVDQSKRDLKLIVEQNGCSNRDSIRNIHVIPKLSPWTVKDSVLCLPDSFAFSVTNPDPTVQYDWSFGDTKTATGPNPVHRYQNPGSYTIQLTVTNRDHCSNTALINNMVYAAPVPVAAFSMSDSIVYNDKPTVTFLNDSFGATSWFWNFGDSITSVLKNPVHDYAVTGRRTVFLKVMSDFNCTDSVSHQVLIAFDRIFPPNGFSPNAPNPIDRVFLLNSAGISAAGYHFVVLSRWDDVVFEAKDEIKGWDGRMKNNSFAPAGSYVWILNYTDFLGRTHRQTGTVTLVY